jgi:Zn-dependent protease with chaperone function
LSVLGAALAFGIAVAMLAPHALALQRASAPTAIAVWLLALTLRAVVAVALAVFALVHLSRVSLVEGTLLNLCWHELVPDLPTWLGLAEHPISHTIVAVPLLALGISVLVHLVNLARSWAALRRRLAEATRTGPLGSTVIPDEHIFLAATQLGRGRIVVSDRAIEAMDEEELVAGLMHELGHLRRLHRPLLLVSSLLAAISRPLPGSAAALNQLRYQLERDADAYAIRRLRTPLALASAICKVAAHTPPAATAALGGQGMVTLRLQELLGDAPPRSAAVERISRLLALALALLAFGLVATSPAWAFREAQYHQGHPCSHR